MTPQGFARLRPGQALARARVPLLGGDDFRRLIADAVARGQRVAALFADVAPTGVSVYAVLADNASAALRVGRMALDSEHHRAFLACEDNDTLTVFDLDKHAAVAHLPMASGADVVGFDPGLLRVYVACGSGAISIFQEDDADHYHKVQDFPVQKRVHSLVVDRKTHRVYAPEEQEDGRPVARIIVYEPRNIPRSK